MLRETETDRAADSIESVGTPDQQKFHIDNSEELVWCRASSENIVIKNLEKLVKLLGYSIAEYSKKVEKQLEGLKRF